MQFGSFAMQILLNPIGSKKYIDILKQIIITAVLLCIALGIFAVCGNLRDFINYAFLGIGEFGGKNFHFSAPCTLYIFITIVTTVCAIFINKKIASKEQKRNITSILCQAIAMLGIIYPIVNDFHSILAILVSAVLLMYLTDIVVKEFLTPKITNIVIGVLVISFGLIAIKGSIVIFNNSPFDVEYNNPYFGVYVSNEIKDNINKVNQYIKENKKVIIFSKEAALYNVPEKRSNGAMDLPFLGNLGHGGEEKMLEEIKNKIGYKILLTKENYWQESDKITSYIRDNYEKIDDIEEFEIYQIN